MSSVRMAGLSMRTAISNVSDHLDSAVAGSLASRRR
jgi:hypothetical protein